MTSVLNLEGILDFNSLFTFNFDYLKTIIEALIHSNKAINQKMLKFEESLKDKDEKIKQ